MSGLVIVHICSFSFLLPSVEIFRTLMCHCEVFLPVTFLNFTLKPGCIECGVVRIDSAIVVCITIGVTSAFVNPAGQLLLTQRGKTRMDVVGIVFEFYIAPL